MERCDCSHHASFARLPWSNLWCLEGLVHHHNQGDSTPSPAPSFRQPCIASASSAAPFNVFGSGGLGLYCARPFVCGLVCTAFPGCLAGSWQARRISTGNRRKGDKSSSTSSSGKRQASAHPHSASTALPSGPSAAPAQAGGRVASRAATSAPQEVQSSERQRCENHAVIAHLAVWM